MTLNTAIKRAIEGGYRDKANVTAYQLEINSQLILLDPQFWQCLGVAEGWKKQFAVASFETDGTQDEYGLRWTGGIDKSSDVIIPEWHYRQYEFIDALADGKTSDEYFNNLLRK